MISAKNSNSSRAATAHRRVKRVDADTVELTLAGRDIQLRIPDKFRSEEEDDDDAWDPEKVAEAPPVEFGMEWLYGYRGKDLVSASNLHCLPKTGELAYFCAAVVVLFNDESQTQRHYRGHTNDVECLAVHTQAPICASGQAEGLNNTTTVQRPHVQIWNYDTLDTLHLIGLDEFESSIVGVALSSKHDDEDDFLLAIVDASQKPEITVWSHLGQGQEPKKVGQATAASHRVTSIGFYPGLLDKFVSAGHGHVAMWDFDGSNSDLNKTQGLFTRKIERPKEITCIAFSGSGEEVLTGDSDGNVMVWKGNKVIRVLKGAHQGPVGDIIVMDEDDGSFVSGGLEDGAFVVFDSDYNLIGAGASLPVSLAGVRKMFKKTYSEKEEEGSKYFHLLVGTTSNRIAEVSFRTDSSTNILDLEIDTLVFGHAGSVLSVAEVSNMDQFFSGGKDQNLILWDAIAHKAVWHSVLSSAVNSITVSNNNDEQKGLFAVGLDNGIVMVADLETKHLETVYEIDDEKSVDVVTFSPDGEYLAVAAHDNKIHLLKKKDDDDENSDGNTHMFDVAFKLSGHSSHINHLDWSEDGDYLRSNSADHEVLYWSVSDEEQLTEPDFIGAIEDWAAQKCTLSFETLGLWSRAEDGTDVNACDASGDVIVAGDDYGRVRAYKYPAVQPRAGSVELLGHSAHVMDVAFLGGGSRMVSAGGREASIIQWDAKYEKSED